MSPTPARAYRHIPIERLPGMKIAVSACLLGTPCRYDGTSRPCKAVCDLRDRYDLIPICPELLGGFTVPHPPSEIDSKTDDIKVFDSEGTDVTGRFLTGAYAALRKLEKEGCKLAILKSHSPSCATDYLYDGTFTDTLLPGTGIAARLLRSRGIRVINESRFESCTEAVLADSSRTTPTLHTERLTLRPLVLDDAADLFEFSRDPGIGMTAGWEPLRSLQDSIDYIVGEAAAPHFFGIFENGNDHVIGTVSLSVDNMRKNTEAYVVRYSLAREKWNNGYSREATYEIIRYGFEDLRLSMLSAGHYLFNPRTDHVLLECGFSNEGVFRQYEATPDGIMQDVVAYSITKEEYFSENRQNR